MIEKTTLDEIFSRFEAHQPHPQTELYFFSPFTLVAAVALSAQTTDVAVNKVTRPLFERAATPQAILELGEEVLIEALSSIGLYRNKAKNLRAMCDILIEKYGGEVPLEREALQSLPGVGRKTASVVLNELGIEPAIAVDTHVFRLSHRLGLSTSPTPDKVEADLMALIPKNWQSRAHHWLILHGRYVCVARKPKCDTCHIVDLCPKIGL